MKLQLSCWAVFVKGTWFKHIFGSSTTKVRSTMHLKFNRIGVRIHNLQIMNSTFHVIEMLELSTNFLLAQARCNCRIPCIFEICGGTASVGNCIFCQQMEIRSRNQHMYFLWILNLAMKRFLWIL